MRQDTKFYLMPQGTFGESTLGISKTNYTARKTIFPKDGDIYLRIDHERNTLMVIRLNGESDLDFDMNFGAGLESHGGKTISIDQLKEDINASEHRTELIDRINDVFLKEINLRFMDQ